MKLGLAKLSFLGFAAALAFYPGHAQAFCGQWEMPDRMLIRQSNATNVEVTLRPSHGGFIGNASYFSRGRSSTEMVGSGFVTGALEGTIRGADMHFTIHWEYDPHKMVNSRTGIYAGIIGAHGRITGTAYAGENPAETATWWVEEILRCRDGATLPGGASPTPNKPPPIPLGRKQRPSEPVPDSAIGNGLPPICVSAKKARDRGSPVAERLETQCIVALRSRGSNGGMAWVRVALEAAEVAGKILPDEDE